MASPNVQVDIVVGQNTVVPALNATSAAMEQTTRTSRALDFRMEGLSRGGLKKLESGFKAMASQSIPQVNGAMGKMVEGLLLLGAGSTVVLAVAAGAAVIAKVIERVKETSDAAATSLSTATVALEEFLNPKDPLGAQIKVIEERIQALQLSMLNTFDAERLKAFNAEIVRLQGLLGKVSAKRAPAPAAPGKVAGTKATKSGTQPDAAPDWWLNQDFTQQSAVRDLTTQLAGLNAELLKVPLNMAGVDAVMAELDASFAKAADTVGMYFDAFSDAFMGLAEGMGAVAAGMADLGTVLSTALAEAVSGAAKMMAKYELGQAAASFAAALGPIPQPGMVAAGIKHLAAAAAFGVVAGLAGAAGAAGGGSAGQARAVSGGVDRGQYSRDQKDLATRGKLTLNIKDGVMSTRSPEFRDMIADVIREAGDLRELEITTA